ncbi:MAG: DNA repair protein RecO [Planctomycetes bacterium]|nr:DNA repair protein RecO [Planctomycetota bacterium]
MARYLRTEGICLRRLDYSNTSQVAGFLTPDAGRLSFMAKGVTRAPKKGVRTGFDLLGRYEIVYTPRRAGGLQNLTYRWLREDFRGLRRSLPSLLCGYYAAELVLNFTMEADPCPRLYQLLLAALRRFASGERLGNTVLMLEAGALVEHGAWPQLGRCVLCGGPLPERGAVTFSAREGGALCAECERGPIPDTIPLRADLLRELASLPGRKEVPALPPVRTVALSTALRFHMRYLLGKELRMWEYLQRRKLSRALGRLRRAADKRRRRQRNA